jgi:hypothetical protein
MTEHPERVASEPTIPGKILTAAANAAVAALVKKLLERGITRLADARPDEAATPSAGAEAAPVGPGLQRYASTS